MNLRIFFNPVNDAILEPETSSSTWRSNIRIYHEQFPSWQEADIAIIGLTEERGNLANSGVSKGIDAVRRCLYRLRKGTGRYSIVDLGDLRNGEDPQQTRSRLKEVCEILLQNQVVPVIIGGTHDMDLGQFMAYEAMERPVNMVTVDSFIDMDDQFRAGDAGTRLRSILTTEPNFLFHYGHIGYHSFLVDKECLEVLEKLYFETYRVGQVRENIEEMEPVLRSADLVSFDVSAIRQSDAPGNKHTQPFGLTGEEACRLSWYAGLNPRLTSFGVYEFNPLVDVRDQTAGVIATMVWYLVEGFYHRNLEMNVNDPRFTRFIVALKEEPHKIVFYKDTLTEKWWMEVPYDPDKGNLARNSLVPCSYNDYQIAGKGEIPDRWLLAHAKLS